MSVDEDGLTADERLMARVIWDEFHKQYSGDAPDIEPRSIAQAISATLTRERAAGRRPSIPLTTAMDTLSRLAGWTTVPHPDDLEVVRLGIHMARARHNPDQGAKRAVVKLLDEVERTWLDYVL